MTKQTMTFTIENIGKIILSSMDDIKDYNTKCHLTNCTFHSNNHLHTFKVELSDNILVNDKNNNVKSPIYCTVSDKKITNICLLEETGYKIEFESYNKKVKLDKIFPSIKRNNSNDIKFEHFGDKGILNFKSYAGKTFIDLIYNNTLYQLPIEVRSKKINYDKDYVQMIDDLSEHASDLMLNIKGPLYQNRRLDEYRTNDYDSFLILTYIFKEENLPTVFDYLSYNLSSNIITYPEETLIMKSSSIKNNDLRNILTHPEYLIKSNDYGFIPIENDKYLPITIIQEKYKDSIDNPENRFYKYFLELLEDIIISLIKKIEEGYEKEKLKEYKNKLNQYLSKNYFKKISKLDYIPLNSQILQKKEGYRDILRFYLMLELGNQITWTDVNEMVKGYQKRLSKMYEYWGFFKLLDVMEKLTNSKINEELIDFSDFSVKLSENMVIQSFKPYIAKNNQEISIKLMYNKSFNNTNSNKPNNQYYSYSVELKPDFTIELNIDNDIKYIHFDTKYKTKKTSKNKKNDTGVHFQEEDIKKMHAYKDGIPNTICAYIFYPEDEKITKFPKYNEDNPEGVGAFPLRPKQEHDYDGKKLKNFIKDIIEYEVERYNKNNSHSDIHD